MTKKYFFFDIDGTLLSEVDKKLPDSCKETLKKLIDKGHFVAIATSRPYCLTYEIAREIGISHYVCDGGDAFVINDEIIELLPLNLKDCLSLAKESIDAHIPIATSIDTTNNRYSPDSQFINEYPHLMHVFDFVIKDNFNILEAKAIHKMCILCSKDKENLLPSLNKVPHYRLDDQCILVEAVNKYQGILNMMKYLNAPVEDIVVFGDGINDLDMLTQAPISIAMGNAKDEVKHAATYVTSCASQDGIKKACQYFEWID
ncbi:MAG: HAD family hydrolase [Bacilli bacterium]|nr:HAD family hydrolase [Bacilli bacterium]